MADNAIVVDSFSGAGADTDLEAWTPDVAGAGYSLLSGVAGTLAVDSAGALVKTDSGSGFYSLDDDMGNADMYAEGVVDTLSGNYQVIRATNENNWIGVRRQSGTLLQMYRRVSGSYTLMGSGSTVSNGSLLRIEAVGDDFEAFIDGVSKITATSTFNNTVTTAGLFVNVNIGNFRTSWEFGNFLGGGGGAAVPVLYHHRRVTMMNG